MSKKLQIKCWMVLFAVVGYIAASVCKEGEQNQIVDIIEDTFKDLRKGLD